VFRGVVIRALVFPFRITFQAEVVHHVIGAFIISRFRYRNFPDADFTRNQLILNLLFDCVHNRRPPASAENRCNNAYIPWKGGLKSNGKSKVFKVEFFAT
jgi:hypothetical protein